MLWVFSLSYTDWCFFVGGLFAILQCVGFHHDGSCMIVVWQFFVKGGVMIAYQ